jgi:NAD(P)H-dependent FMN reductase
MQEFDAPSYDQGVEGSSGFPPRAEAFRRRLLANDAFVIASPEYNASMPGLLKNAIEGFPATVRSLSTRTHS